MDCWSCEHHQAGECQHPAVRKGYTRLCPFPDQEANR